MNLNSRSLAIAVVSFVMMSFVAEIANGQLLFRRRREAMKAEMKWELQQQLNSNLNSQVDSARADLSASASAQIQQEAAALRASLKEEIVAMRSEADKIVADEKARIAQEAAKQIARIEKQTQEKVEASRKELVALNQKSIAAAEVNLKKALEGYSKALSDKNGESFVKIQKETTTKFDALKQQMETLIDKDVAAEVEKGIKEQMAKSKKELEAKVSKMIEEALAKSKKQMPEPKEEKKAEPEKNALLNRTPRLTEEVIADGDA